MKWNDWSADPLERAGQFRERFGRGMTNVVVATDRAMAVGEVLVVNGQRFAVSEPLTEEEFQRRMLETERKRRRQEAAMGVPATVAAQGTFESELDGASARNARFAETPDPSMRYFYALREI